MCTATTSAQQYVDAARSGDSRSVVANLVATNRQKAQSLAAATSTPSSAAATAPTQSAVSTTKKKSTNGTLLTSDAGVVGASTGRVTLLGE